MPLQKQLLELPIAKGLGQKFDPRLLKVGAHTTLSNVVQDKIGSLSKRPGVLALSATQHSPNSHTLNQYTLGDSRLVPSAPGGVAQVSGLRMWSRGSIASGDTSANDLDDVPALLAKRFGVAVGAKAFVCFDVACDGKSLLVLWVSPQPAGGTTALYAVLDLATLEAIVPPTTLASSVSQANPNWVRLASTPLGAQDVIAAVFQVGTNLYGCTFTFSTRTWTNSVALVADCNTSTAPGTAYGIYGITMPSTTTAIVAYGTTASPPVVQTNSYPVSTWTGPTTRSITPPGSAGLHIYGLAIKCDNNSHTWVAYSVSGGATNAQRAFGLNTGVLTVLAADTLLWTETSTLLYRMSIGVSPAGLGTSVLIAGSSFANGNGTATLNWCSFSTAAAVGTVLSRYGLAVASDIWTLSTAKNMILVLYQEGDPSFANVTVQRTYYALELGQTLLGTTAQCMPHATIAPRIVTTAAGDALEIPNVIPLSSNQRFLTLGTTVRSAAGGIGIDLIDLQFNKSLWQPAKLGGVTYLSGGVPCAFDGQRVTEIGMLYQPPSLGSSVGGGGSVGPSSGTFAYTYSVVYEWRDATGQRCQSRPTSASVSCTNNTNTVTLTIPPLNLTLRQDTEQQNQQVGIAVYRDTATSPGNQVRIFSADIPAALINQFQSTNLSYADTASDASISANEALYTSGGIYDAVCPSSLSCLIAHNERLAGVGDDGQTIWLSTEYDGGSTQPYFNDGLVITIGEGSGTISALASMDGQLFAFKRDSIFAIAGDGPTINQGGNSWNQPQRLASDVGCSSDWRSVVSFSLGIAFQNGTKLYLLSRALEVSYFSGPIEDTLAANPVIKSATLNAARNELRFCLATTETSGIGVVANYNYVTDTWSTFSYYSIATGDTTGVVESAIVVDGLWYHADPSGNVYAEHANANGYDVDQVPTNHWITATVASAWAIGDGIESFKRFWDALAFFTPVSPCDLTMSVGYNYSNSFTDVRLFTAANIATFSTPQPQMVVNCTLQKSESARLQISDAPPTGVGQTSGTGATLLSMGFLLGLKGGRMRLPATQGA